MPKSNPLRNISLNKPNGLFQSTVKKMDGESVVEIPLEELYAPDFHPFQVNDDEAMNRLVNNIKQYGVREPGLARPRIEGGYELLCGNRRKRACELAGISSLPVIIRELDDDNAVIAMVDSNLEQREKLLLSEKAWAYQVKLEALNHQGVKSDNLGELSVEILCKQTGESKNQIFRSIRLTKLIVTLIDKVDAKQLAFNPAVELSYLSQKQQTAVAATMDKYEVKPSLSQAQRLKKITQSRELTVDDIEHILSESKKLPKEESNNLKSYSKYFPSDYTKTQMNDTIVKLLTEWNMGVAG